MTRNNAEILHRPGRLRDDHPWGAQYQHDAVTRFSAQKGRHFLLTTARLEDAWLAFGGNAIPCGYVVANLWRWDGDATQIAFGVIHPTCLITFPIGREFIAGWNSLSDKDLLSEWDQLFVSGWPQRIGPSVNGDEHRRGFKAYAAVQQEAELLAEIDAIPTEEEVQRREDQAAKRSPITDDDINAGRVTFRDGVSVVLQATQVRGGPQS